MTPEQHFSTERLRFWRAKQLSAEFEKTIEHIERHGCSIMHISADDVSPRFSYTVGLYDTANVPELIAIGLTEKAAHFALNEAAKWLREGKD